jgi:hypothetical protein
VAGRHGVRLGDACAPGGDRGLARARWRPFGAYTRAMASGIVLMLISAGAVFAGRGYVRAARAMRGFETTRGRVIAREVAVVPSADTREGHWGKGGGYWPKATYVYEVGGQSYTSDRLRYGWQGLKQSVAEQELAAIPDEIDVYYDPAAPQVAYRVLHKPRLGYALITGGAFGVLIALVLIVGSL